MQAFLWFYPRMLGTKLHWLTEVCRLVVTNLRREFAHARNFQFKNPHQKLRMREFSSQICDNQPANLCNSCDRNQMGKGDSLYAHCARGENLPSHAHFY